MAVLEPCEGKSKCFPETGSLQCLLEPGTSQMASDILKNTTVKITSGQGADKLTKSLDRPDKLLTSSEPVVLRDAKSEKRVHALEASLSDSLKELGNSQLLRASIAGKSILKRPVRAGTSRAPVAGTSETVTLKKALRGLTLAQAAESASLKRIARTPGTTHLVDADAIKQRYRAILDPQMLEPGTSKKLPVTEDASYKKECTTLASSQKTSEVLHRSNVCLSGSGYVNEASHSSIASISIEKGDHQSREARMVNSSESGTYQIDTENDDSMAKCCSDQSEITDIGCSSVSTLNQSNDQFDMSRNIQARANSSPTSASSSYHSILASLDSDTGAVNNNCSKKADTAILSCRNRQFNVVNKVQSLKSNERCECPDISKSSASRGSASSGVSDESSCSSSSGNRPHMSSDSRWEAIRFVRARDGCLGLKHFSLLKRLGCGDIGSVYLTELNGTNCYFAMKVMDNGSLATRKKMLRAQTEKEILQMLDHPFLPTLYTHFETDKFSCLVMEYCPGGDLHILRQRQPGRNFSEQAARFYAAEVLLALEYLHMLGVVYRDLKPENVLVREDGHIMLSDFDLSLRCSVSPTLVRSSTDVDPNKRNSAFCIQPACIPPACSDPLCVEPPCIQPSCFAPRFMSQRPSKARKSKPETGYQVSPVTELVAEPTNARSNSFVGTHEYLAPEIVKGEGHGSAVDWWTFGIFLYELLFGKTPFKGESYASTLNNVVSQSLKFPETPVVSYAAKDLVRGLLVKEPQHRLASKRGAAEIKQHSFFEGLNWALVRCSMPPEVPKVLELCHVSPANSANGKGVIGDAVTSAKNQLESGASQPK